MNKTEENLILSFPTLTRETECGVQSKTVQWSNQIRTMSNNVQNDVLYSNVVERPLKFAFL